MKTVNGVASKVSKDAGELIDMAEAIAMLKTSRPTFYRWLRSGKFKGLKVGRQWRFYRSDIDAFLKGSGPRIDLPVDIAPLVAQLEAALRESGGGAVPKGGAGEDPASRAVALMLALAVRRNASDLHVANHVPEGAGQPEGCCRLRVDGRLQGVARFDARLVGPVVEQLKRMAACDVNEKRLPQDGRILMDMEGGSHDLRACFLPSVLGETVTVRVLGRTSLRKLAELPYADYDRARIEEALAAPNGLVLCTGPTGSGKTTSLYACLNTVAAPQCKVVTVEDPVEYMLPFATQVPVHSGLSFPQALRAMLRSDPDVLLIGEIRDRETMQIALQCVLTGHLVLSSLHMTDAVGALLREVDLGVNPFLVADTPQLIIAQRLVRRLCDACAVPSAPTPGEVEGAAEWLPTGRPNPLDVNPACRKPVGCSRCASTGFKGRTMVEETLRMSPALGRALRKGASYGELRDLAVSQGMVPMAAHCVDRVARGETTLSELRRLFAG